jgi:hypothetical protein
LVAARPTIRPRTDDRPLWDVVFGVYAYPAIFAAHGLKLFPFLAGGPRMVDEICEGPGLERRPGETMLAACASLGFLERRGGRFALTALAEDYLLESSPTYFGGYWDLNIDNYEVWTYAGIEKAILTNAPQVAGGEEFFVARGAGGDGAGLHARDAKPQQGPGQAWAGRGRPLPAARPPRRRRRLGRPLDRGRNDMAAAPRDRLRHCAGLRGGGRVRHAVRPREQDRDPRRRHVGGPVPVGRRALLLEHLPRLAA